MPVLTIFFKFLNRVFVALACATLYAALPLVSAHATDLRISQIADTAPTLTVYVSTDEVAKLQAPQGNAHYVAILGDRPVPVKRFASFSTDQGTSLVIAVDISGSINKKTFAAIKAAVAETLLQLDSTNHIALIGIGSDVRVIENFSNPFNVIKTRVNELEADAPETALYEAILMAQELASRSTATLPTRRAVLVITDGMDDSRKGFSKDENLRKLGAAAVPVYAIGIPTDNTPKQKKAIKDLAQIARESGGAFSQADASTVKQAVLGLIHKMNQTEVLILDCAACTHDGVLRTLHINRVNGDEKTTAERRVSLLASTSPVVTTSPVPASTPTPTPRPSKTPEPTSTPTTTPPPPCGPGAVKECPPSDWLQVLANFLGKIAIILRQIFIIISIVVAILLIPEKTRRYLRVKLAEPAVKFVSRVVTYFVIHPVNVVTMAVMGVASPGREIVLVIKDKGKRVIQLSGELQLGRADTNNDQEASTKHACIYETKGKIMLRDLGSVNGTFLNGVKIINPEPLTDDDLILIGRTEIRIHFKNKAESDKSRK
jgi:hypothetical protein